MFMIPLWIVVVSNPAGLFTPHPLFQSFGVVVLLNGILLLQPTKTAVAKKTGLQAHQIAQAIGLFSVAAGATFIIVNKALHGAAHFTTFHARFGLAVRSRCGS